MFEQSVLDNSSQKRSKWSWMGLVVQAGVVTAMLLVPMVSPEILSIVAPKALVYVPAKPVQPVEIEVQQPTGRPSTQNTVVRTPVRVFRAPSTIQPVANIIDSETYAPPIFTMGPPTVVANTAIGGGSIGLVPTAPPPKPPEPVKRAPDKPLRVGGSVLAAKILSRTTPVYPPLAKQARISGLVRLEGIIAKDGTIQNLKVLSGHPALVPAALTAVQQWRYKPTLLNGEPVEVVAPIDVNFILSN